jgi:hypothetical protein
MNLVVSFESSGEKAAQLAQRSLGQRGLQVVRSFDLLGSESDACSCRYHGTPRCTCQYSVLLVYPAAGPPAVVTVHGHESHTRLEIVLDANSPPNAELIDQILETLAETSMGSSSPSPAPLPEAGASTA